MIKIPISMAFQIYLIQRICIIGAVKSARITKILPNQASLNNSNQPQDTTTNNYLIYQSTITNNQHQKINNH